MKEEDKELVAGIVHRVGERRFVTRELCDEREKNMEDWRKSLCRKMDRMSAMGWGIILLLLSNLVAMVMK